MTGGGSLRYEIRRYEKLIKDYIENGSTELGNLVLTGDELLDFAKTIENYYDEYGELEEKYDKLEKNHKQLINNLESLFKGKEESSLVRKVRILLDNSKENLEED